MLTDGQRLQYVELVLRQRTSTRNVDIDDLSVCLSTLKVPDGGKRTREQGGRLLRLVSTIVNQYSSHQKVKFYG